MRGTTASIHAFDLYGGSGCVDDIYVGIARPEGLSSDGDDLPDEWEWRNLGSLERDGTGDLDNDGLSDFDEYAAGTNPASADTDGDGLPDAWEIDNGLDPLDASDAALDSDGDGLSNLAEFNAGTDPHLSDTDGDGLPDAWELSSGTDPFSPDALADPDGDGLVNLAEFQHGTDIGLADTDGDGISDGEEACSYLSDPLTVDFDGSIATNAVIVASAVDEAVGEWYFMEDCVLLAGRSGRIFYIDDLVLPDDGLFQIRTLASFRGPSDAECVCYVDGMRIGCVRLQSSAQESISEVCFNAPWLPAGAHVLSFELQNFENDVEFALGDIAVCAVCGPDADGNGVADWIDARYRNTGTCRGTAVSSKVSPFCMRVVSALPPVVSVGGVSLEPRVLPNCGWWVNVPLEENEAAGVGIEYENGFKSEEVSVVWSPFDVMTESDTVLRRGDSLLLSIDGGGTISVDGATVAEGSSVSIPFCFNTPGDHVVEGIVDGVVNRVVVAVVECSVSSEHPVWRGKTSTLRLSGSGFDRMSALVDCGVEIASVSLSSGQCACSLHVPVRCRPNAFACEIPNPDASVAGSAKLLPFLAHYTLEGKYYVLERLDDGTLVVENRLSAFDLPSCVELKMTSSSGICFEDGSGKLTITSGDLDGCGDFVYRFLVPSGVKHPCQFLHGYFEGKEVFQ